MALDLPVTRKLFQSERYCAFDQYLENDFGIPQSPVIGPNPLLTIQVAKPSTKSNSEKNTDGILDQGQLTLDTCMPVRGLAKLSNRIEETIFQMDEPEQPIKNALVISTFNSKITIAEKHSTNQVIKPDFQETDKDAEFKPESDSNKNLMKRGGQSLTKTASSFRAKTTETVNNAPQPIFQDRHFHQQLPKSFWKQKEVCVSNFDVNAFAPTNM